MGCDIHLYVERQNQYGFWLKVEDPMRECFACKGEGVENSRPCYWCKGEGKRREEFYSGRNYDLFAILANVRNGYGFAGVPTGEGFMPISMPRGLPEDASDEVEEKSEHWGGDGHSHSWFTIAELEAYDWQQTAVHYGVVGADEYKTYRANGKPDSCSGDVSGSSVTKIDNQTMDNLLRDGKDASGYFTAVKWEEKYADSCEFFLKETLPELKTLGDPDKVRIVFWFDN